MWLLLLLRAALITQREPASAAPSLLPWPVRTMLRRRRPVWDFICGPKVKCMAVCQTRGGQHGTLHTRRRDARALFKENEFEYDDSMSEEQRAGFLWARGKHPPFVPPIAAGGADT